MTNPPTTDRRDVAHPTNPIGGNENIEQDISKPNLSPPVDQDAAKLPAGGSESAIGGVPGGAKPDEGPSDVYGGLPGGVPPARSGQAQVDVQPAQPDSDAPSRMDQKRADGRDTVHVQSPLSPRE